MVLTILEAFPKDAGTYSMQASNNAGTVSGTCTVSVKGRLPAETSDSELASDLEPTKPSVPMRLKDTTVVEGERVRLDCIIVGQPEPEVLIHSKDNNDNTLFIYILNHVQFFRANIVVFLSKKEHNASLLFMVILKRLATLTD